MYNDVLQGKARHRLLSEALPERRDKYKGVSAMSPALRLAAGRYQWRMQGMLAPIIRLSCSPMRKCVYEKLVVMHGQLFDYLRIRHEDLVAFLTEEYNRVGASTISHPGDYGFW